MKWKNATYFIAQLLWGISVILEGSLAYRVENEHTFFICAFNINVSTTEIKEVEYHSFDTSLRVYMSDEEYNNVTGRMNDMLSPAIITSEEDENEPLFDYNPDGSDSFTEPSDGSY